MKGHADTSSTAHANADNLLKIDTMSSPFLSELSAPEPLQTIEEDELPLSYYATQSATLISWIWICHANTDDPTQRQSWLSRFRLIFTPLHPLRSWVDSIQVRDRQFAHLICQLIPSQCPFERDIKFRGKTLFHIPPLCKLNPLYDEVVALRFRALCYLADECNEDISAYC